MSKPTEVKRRIIKGTKIPVAHGRDTKQLFENKTNLKKVYDSTPTSSKDSGRPIRFEKLKFPIVAAKTQTRTFSSNITVNFNFSSGFVNQADVGKPVLFEFTGSRTDQLDREKNTNHAAKLRPSNVQKEGSNVVTITRKASDSGLERHKHMFKSRFAKKRNNCEKGYLGGIRLNRRFDLIMEFREEQMAAARVAM